jgi:segregation and condensation protein A
MTEDQAVPTLAEGTQAEQHFKHAFTIKTPVFEGPLDLLLNLIEKKKLFISDISLSKVTDEYISHIKELPEYSLKHRTQFILIASTLLLIKAKSLLPTLELTPEEEGDIKDLERRLKILNLIRQRSTNVRELYGTHRIYPRGEMDEAIVIFAPGIDLAAAYGDGHGGKSGSEGGIGKKTGKENLKDAIYRVLHSLPKPVIEQKATVKKVISLEEMMDRLEDRINNAMKMTFRQFSNSKDGGGGGANSYDRAERVNIILSFLAMLELVKQGAIDVSQERTFEEIEMERMKIGVPEYSEPENREAE